MNNKKRLKLVNNKKTLYFLIVFLLIFQSRKSFSQTSDPDSTPNEAQKASPDLDRKKFFENLYKQGLLKGKLKIKYESVNGKVKGQKGKSSEQKAVEDRAKAKESYNKKIRELLKEAGATEAELKMLNPKRKVVDRKELLKNMKGMGGKLKIDPKSMEKLIKISSTTFKKKTEKEVMKDIMGRFKPGSFGHSIFKRNPRILLFCAKIVKDPQALSALSKILVKKIFLAAYGGFVFVTFIFGYAWMRWDAKSDLDISKRLFRKLIRFGVINVVRFGGFYILFKKEVDPTWRIFKSVFIA